MEMSPRTNEPTTRTASALFPRTLPRMVESTMTSSEFSRALRLPFTSARSTRQNAPGRTTMLSYIPPFRYPVQKVSTAAALDAAASPPANATTVTARSLYNAFDAENTGLKHELAAAGKRRETVVANGGFRVGQISSMHSHPGHLERAARTEFGSSGRCAVGRLVTESPVRHPRPGGDGMIERDESIASSDSDTLHWILRISVAACFIGHRAFRLITKAALLPYFAIFGIPEAWAWRLMPVVGAVDVSVGVLTLIQPVRAVILYMTFWGFQTACLRPLAGQGIWELLERAGNYGVPLAFLCLLGAGRSLTDWFSARPMPTLTVARSSVIGWILRATTALLLIGHGGLLLRHGHGLLDYRAR